KLPVGSNAVAAYSAALDSPTEFTYETAFKFDDVHDNRTYIGWRWDASAPSLGGMLWRLGLNADRTVWFEWKDATNTLRQNSIPGAIPGTVADDLGVRVR